MKSFSKIIKIASFLLGLQLNYIQAQQSPVWPVSASVPDYNQINCTFAEKHLQFHGGIDINIGREIFLAILEGKVFNNASESNIFITHHELTDQNNILTNLRKVQYGDETGPLPNINVFSAITQGQEIGIVTDNTDVHLHFEMWIRDCISPNCTWYRVDPLNNPHANYINRPPGYNDIYDVELNDVILEPMDNHSGLMFNSGNGLQAWHYNSCKIHKKDRPDSHGPIHSYYGTPITVFGDILLFDFK